VSRVEALIFGLMLAAGAIVVLGFMVNIVAAALLGFTIFFHVIVYAVWLKRRTPQNIVIGGAAGELPAVIGWAAAARHVKVEPLVLFLIIFLWTPAHFWHCHSTMGANTPALVSRCCRSWPAGLKQKSKS
jgi:protoheme IX farnesyltransferase